jgi:hypothetical protein
MPPPIFEPVAPANNVMVAPLGIIGAPDANALLSTDEALADTPGLLIIVKVMVFE